ncbi:uncharacterized protein LOC111705205 [Eurytemora carolleeae]|uniref:uncharacterized protein LOC111705205 n=1 Tax=Eurytemora carolleeae TaxID=1294199 RepID=UPI000C794488|nr:uncharacterized protein LOC111705205 [Eurytemora carolleeae]|eukprot:XP_023333450.1 uncharacterized protein LOC111705205 [Eurytemora affinis]
MMLLLLLAMVMCFPRGMLAQPEAGEMQGPIVGEKPEAGEMQGPIVDEKPEAGEMQGPIVGEKPKAGEMQGHIVGEKPANNSAGWNRKERIFSLFNIVQFPNLACNSLDTVFPVGTCFTTSECTSKGGTTSGSCAAGFGVCCLFKSSTCGGTFSNNMTYITNPGFPATFNTAGTCTFTVNKCQADICQLRLDFLTSVQGVSANTQGCCGAGCTTAADSLTVTGQTGVNPPVICGTNTGEHMYVEVGSLAADSVSLAFSVAGTTNDQWNIRVSQIPCSANYRAPTNCVKYFTGSSGTVTSYGFTGNTLLQSQNYDSCIRQEAGFCSIQWDESTVTAPADPFDLTGAQAAGAAENIICANSFIHIPNGFIAPAAVTTAAGNTDGAATPVFPSPALEFCGEVLGLFEAGAAGVIGVTASSVTTSTLPFSLSTFTTAVALNDQGGNAAQGYSLDYTQQAC